MGYGVSTRQERSWNRLANAACALSVAVGVSIFTSGAVAGGSQQSHSIKGTVSITPSSDSSSALQIAPFDTSAVDCQDPQYATVVEGFDDLTPGAQVTVRNASGKLIAIGKLRDGTIKSMGYTCVMPFTVRNVPNTSFYRVEVAHRGNVNYSLKEMRTSGWRISLTIG